jgi:hypothetical protein
MLGSVPVARMSVGRTLAGSMFGVMSLLAAPSAHAELFGEGRAGAGLGSGHFEFEKNYQNDMGFIVPAQDEGGPIGIPIVLEAMGGYAVSDSVALGLVVRGELSPYVVRIEPRYATIGAHLHAGVGPMLALRPGKSLDLRIAMEWMTAHPWGATEYQLAPDNVFELEALSGPGALLSLGCCAQRGFGIAAELHAAWLKAEHTRFLPVTFAVLATWATR